MTTDTHKSPVSFQLIESRACAIIVAEFCPNLRVDLKVARQIVSKRLALAADTKHFLVADLSNVREVSPEAKAFLQEPESGLKNILGAAFVASNPVSALIANIFLKATKKFQAKFFSDKETALDWIKSLSKPVL